MAWARYIDLICYLRCVCEQQIFGTKYCLSLASSVVLLVQKTFSWRNLCFLTITASLCLSSKNSCKRSCKWSSTWISITFFVFIILWFKFRYKLYILTYFHCREAVQKIFKPYFDKGEISLAKSQHKTWMFTNIILIREWANILMCILPFIFL